MLWYEDYVSQSMLQYITHFLFQAASNSDVLIEILITLIGVVVTCWHPIHVYCMAKVKIMCDSCDLYTLATTIPSDILYTYIYIFCSAYDNVHVRVGVIYVYTSCCMLCTNTTSHSKIKIFHSLSQFLRLVTRSYCVCSSVLFRCGVVGLASLP